METNRQGTRIVIWGAGTSRTLRAHWVLAELGLAYSCHPIGSRTGETEAEAYRQLNPSRKIPTLIDGDFVLAESGAIVNYLCAAYGRPGCLALPADAQARAHYDEWCFFALMELDATTTYVIRRHADLAAIYGEAPAAIQAARDSYARQAEAAAVRLGPKRYVLGDEFSGADILLTTCLNSAIRRDILLPTVLADYHERITARPAYQRALAANQRP
jgi:glutathione S-transferase